MTEETATREVMRAYRFTLDPTTAQLQVLASHSGSARWAFNHALSAKIFAHEQWITEVAAKVAADVDEPTVRRTTRVPIPMKPAIQKALNAVKGDATKGIEGPCDWWREVSTYVFQSAFADADAAWSNWLASLRGARAGRPVGYPRYKLKHKARLSFRICHTVTQPTIRVVTYRRLLIPRLGQIRIHDSAKRLHRAITAGTAVITSVTISKSGHRWYASVLVRQQQPAVRASKAQRAAGTVGVDIGVRHLAALSTGELVPNPRVKRAHARALARAGRTYARTQKDSRRREVARRRLARLQHLEARRRAGVLHSLTKRLATSWATVAIEA